MSILIVSDIHGNLAALDAVLSREPDAMVVCLGDVVGYGPEPGTCVERIMRRASIAVQGNHDRALADGVSPQCRPHFRWLADATSSLGRAQLTRSQLQYLATLPQTAVLDVARVQYLLVHATPSDPLYRYVGPDPDGWRAEVAALDADVLVVGHTHLQFVLEVDGKRIVNPGSVGQPKDGDPRAAYAVIEGDEIRLERVRYPVEHTIDALERSGVSHDAFEQLAGLLRTGRAPVAPAPTGGAGDGGTGALQASPRFA